MSINKSFLKTIGRMNTSDLAPIKRPKTPSTLCIKPKRTSCIFDGPEGFLDLGFFCNGSGKANLVCNMNIMLSIN